jgi:two-component system response regulator DesR
LIRVSVAHGRTLVRQALAAALSREAGLHVTSELARGEDLLAQARRAEPDVVLLDVALPYAGTGCQLCETLCADLAQCKVLIMSDRQRQAGLAATVARLAPRVGIIATEDTVALLIKSIYQLVEGRFVLDVELAVAAFNASNPLTGRERDILRLAVHGAPAKDIAANLFLSAGTVRNYLARIKMKTGARTRLEAIRYAQEAGWI